MPIPATRKTRLRAEFLAALAVVFALATLVGYAVLGPANARALTASEWDSVHRIYQTAAWDDSVRDASVWERAAVRVYRIHRDAPESIAWLRMMSGAIAPLVVIVVGIAGGLIARRPRGALIAALFVTTLVPLHDEAMRVGPEAWNALAVFTGIAFALALGANVSGKTIARRVATTIIALLCAGGAWIASRGSTPSVHPGAMSALALLGRAALDNYGLYLAGTAGLFVIAQRRAWAPTTPAIGAAAGALAALTQASDDGAAARLMLGLAVAILAGAITMGSAVIDVETEKELRRASGNRPRRWVPVVFVVLVIAFAALPMRTIAGTWTRTRSSTDATMRFAAERVPASWRVLDGESGIGVFRRSCWNFPHLIDRLPDDRAADALRGGGLDACDLVVLDRRARQLPGDLIRRVQAEYKPVSSAIFVRKPRPRH